MSKKRVSFRSCHLKDNRRKEDATFGEVCPASARMPSKSFANARGGIVSGSQILF